MDWLAFNGLACMPKTVDVTWLSCYLYCPSEFWKSLLLSISNEKSTGVSFSSIFTSLCKYNYLLAHSGEQAAIAFWWNNLGIPWHFLFKNHQTLVPHYPDWTHQCIPSDFGDCTQMVKHWLKYLTIRLCFHHASVFGVFTCVQLAVHVSRPCILTVT